jgi:hypothetical protein
VAECCAGDGPLGLDGFVDISSAPEGLQDLTPIDWPRGTVLSRDLLQAARDGRPFHHPINPNGAVTLRRRDSTASPPTRSTVDRCPRSVHPHEASLVLANPKIGRGRAHRTTACPSR